MKINMRNGTKLITVDAKRQKFYESMGFKAVLASAPSKPASQPAKPPEGGGNK